MYGFVPPSAGRRLLAPSPSPLLSPPSRRRAASSARPRSRPQQNPPPAPASSAPRPRPRGRRPPAPTAVLPAAEKERSGSPESDRSEVASLSFSVGITIVTGPSAALRRSAIRALAAQASRPVAIVTSETDEAYGILPATAVATTADETARRSELPAAAPMETSDANPQGKTNSDTKNPAVSEAAGVSPRVEARSSPASASGISSGDGSSTASPTSTPMTPSTLNTPAEEVSPSSEEPAAQASSGATSPELQPIARWCFVPTIDAFSTEVARIAAARDCECIIVDCPSSDSPRELAVKFHTSGSSSLRVDSILCIVDSATVLDAFHAHNSDAGQGTTPPLSSSSNGTAPSTIGATLSSAPSGSQSAAMSNGTATAASKDGRSAESASSEAKEAFDETYAMHVAVCVENANIIAVAGGKNLKQVRQILAALNFGATVVQFDEAQESLPFLQLVNTNLYDPDTVALNATWRRVLLASRGDDPKVVRALPKAMKDASFVYQARRPFHPRRFYDSIKDVATFAGVLRSTGRIWLPTRMQAPLEWEQAGSSATIRAGSPFWAGIPETEWQVTDGQRDRIRKYWDNQYGDRATELVFVGVGFDKDRLQGLLDGCLLQDEEMVFNNLWENFDDPFVQWVPLDADEDDEENLVDTVEEVENEDTEGRISADGNGSSGPPESVVKERDGIVEPDDVPDSVLEKASALDIFAEGYPDDDDSSALKSQPVDTGVYDEDDVIVASWDGSVADGILQQMPRVGLPVTIVTGFLGSGKTTLLNHILTADHGLRIAVLVNEFGEVDIDSQLIEKGDWSDADEILELANGCICCSINDSFVNAVRKILNRKEDVDYLIVETTGVADPVPVINSLMVSDIADDVRVDGILTLVDVENFDGEKHMGSHAALSQILAADTILLSKTDIVGPEAVQKTIDYIKQVRPAARILKSQRGRVPINMILDVGLRIKSSPAHLNPARADGTAGGPINPQTHEQQPSTSAEGAREEVDHEHEHMHAHSRSAHDEHYDVECGSGCDDPTHNHGPGGHSHSSHLDADGFVSTSFKSDRAFVPELFMERFLQNLPEGVFRAKGLLQFHGYEPRYVFNLSGRRYQFEEDEWPEGMAPSNQIVVIGRNLDIDLLRRMLEECHAPSPTQDSSSGT